MDCRLKDRGNFECGGWGMEGEGGQFTIGSGVVVRFTVE